MTVDVLGVQARRDRELRAELAGDRGVKKALEKFEQRASGHGFRHRRSLLAEAIRLNRRMAPAVAEAIDHCRAVLGFDRPVEVFLEPKPVYSAFRSKGRSGPLILGLSSRLLEDFSPAELRFVLGHELGHARFDRRARPGPDGAVVPRGPRRRGRQDAARLYCAGVAVAAAHDGVSDEELAALRALLGAKQARPPDDVAAVRAELDGALTELRGAPLARRAQLIQHLTVIAGVDGHVADEEYAEMARIAEALDVPTTVIDQTLAGAAAPMD